MSHINRRTFLGASVGLGPLSGSAKAFDDSVDIRTRYVDLDAAAAKPVLKRELFTGPVMIETIELLRYRDNYMIRVRSRDGAEGYCVGHNLRMPHLYPIQLMLVNPFFVGKDARNLDRLMADILMYKNNYKYLGYTLLIPMATVEMAILDMLGRMAGKSMGELIGDIHNTEIAIYRANNNRGRSAEDSIHRIKAQQADTGAKAVKFKIGGRRSNPEVPPERTEKLIPLIRAAFDRDITLYADCNGSYDAREAIRIGRLLETHDIDLFEQPVPTDW